MKQCKLCGKTEEQIVIQSHHIISRKQQPALIDCELNKVYLCIDCHTSAPYAVHRNGFEYLKKLRLEKQREYFNIFDKEFYSKEEVKDILEIKQKDVDKLLKLVPLKNCLYKKEDIIRACMGGKILIDPRVDL